MQPAAFKIRNWAKFQHYKNRNPPWIKLHVEILSSEDWVMLDDASKLLAVICMVVAGKHGGEVPNNPSYVRRIAYLSRDPDFKPLIQCRFLEPLATASTMLASARPEKEEDTETEKKHLSEKSDLFDLEPKPGKRNRTYPESFQAFWRDYPTDALMSKSKAFDQWQKLDQPSRDAALRAIPAFRAYCSKNTTYRPVHAQRFLSERRFDGFNAQPIAAVNFEPTNDAGWENRLRVWHESQNWSPKWGPDPTKPDCKCPPALLRKAA